MVKTTRNPPGKVNHALQKGSTWNNCLTHAYWRVPISDWSSNKWTEQCFVKEVSTSRVRCSLSLGRLASMCVEFNSMPINLSTWEGPTVLDATTGAWINIKKRSKVLKEDRHCNQVGSAIKKLSSRWSTYFRPYLCVKTHSRASSNWLKRKGAMQSQKGRYTPDRHNIDYSNESTRDASHQDGWGLAWRLI